MTVKTEVTIHGSITEVWATLCNIEKASDIISGIEKIDVLEKPSDGLVGLTWRETRMLFGKSASVVKKITAAVENEYYRTRAEDGGFVFLTTKRLTESSSGVTLTESHESKPQTFGARVSVPMLYLFRGMIKNALLQDLKEIKAAVERDQG